ncbi:hypothetical protein BAUCODRAFT_74092, partial [Baudoinia panamericana UAMH 10762]
VISRVPFQRLVQEIVRDFNAEVRFQGLAVEALQGFAEEFLTTFLAIDANLLATHANRVMLQQEDVHILYTIMKNTQCINPNLLQ